MEDRLGVFGGWGGLERQDFAGKVFHLMLPRYWNC
jgi:hypothetical protein